MDGEFSHPKMCIRNEVRRLAAIGPQEDNSISGFSGVNDVVRFLEDHQLFSPQFEKRERQPDRQGFKMIRRFAKKVDLSRKFCKLILFFIVDNLQIQLKLTKLLEHVSGILSAFNYQTIIYLMHQMRRLISVQRIFFSIWIRKNLK